jgi:hypothetical protein
MRIVSPSLPGVKNRPETCAGMAHLTSARGFGQQSSTNQKSKGKNKESFRRVELASVSLKGPMVKAVQPCTENDPLTFSSRSADRREYVA